MTDVRNEQNANGIAVFGGGCFWCTEAVFLMLKGVTSVEPGYAGPQYKNEKGPSYEEVSTGTTPYVESAKIVFNPDEIFFRLKIIRI